MSIDDSILVEVFKDISFSAEETTLIEATFEKVELKKGITLLRADETVLNQYYVQKGCLRTYYIDSTGKEHTLQFAVNDWWISDYTAFFSSTKAIMNIECIQDATLYKISKKNIDRKILREILKKNSQTPVILRNILNLIKNYSKKYLYIIK